MASENMHTRQAGAFRNELRQSCGALVGIVQGILADGALNGQEVRFLHEWLAQTEAVSSVWPGSLIAQQVRNALADGVITTEERAHLTHTLCQLIGGALDALDDLVDSGDLAASGMPLVNKLALDAGATIQFAGQNFCLTGDFVFGPRRSCEEAIALRGGAISNVTKKLNYLVVGGLGSTEWKHGSYGTKVEKAVTLRANGARLLIVHEDAWAAALS